MIDFFQFVRGGRQTFENLQKGSKLKEVGNHWYNGKYTWHNRIQGFQSILVKKGIFAIFGILVYRLIQVLFKLIPT